MKPRAHWLGPDLLCRGCGKDLAAIKKERRDPRDTLTCSGVLYLRGRDVRENPGAGCLKVLDLEDKASILHAALTADGGCDTCAAGVFEKVKHLATRVEWFEAQARAMAQYAATAIEDCGQDLAEDRVADFQKRMEKLLEQGFA